jgi:hypothetical protein
LRPSLATGLPLSERGPKQIVFLRLTQWKCQTAVKDPTTQLGSLLAIAGRALAFKNGSQSH